MENRKCPKINAFCYVCGHMVPKSEGKERKNLFSVEFKFAYTRYFDEVDLSGEDFTPNAVCMACYCNLSHWLHRRRTKLHFIKPVIWMKDPNGHDASRCYACINFDPTFNKKKSKTKKYVAAFTASLPVPLSAGVEPPKAPSPDTVSVLTAASGLTDAPDAQDPDWMPDVEDNQPKPLTQNEMDYIVAKLGLSQRNSEMLASFLKRRKLTKQDVSATAYRKRQAEYQKLYTVNDENTFTYCNDIKGLVNKLEMEYIAGDWRLFIDGSVSSLKAVLLHKTNKQPSIPLAFGTNMKETYETLGSILKEIKYDEHKWKICCDLKVVNILQGVIAKGGFPKFYCFLCNWDSRSKIDHYLCHDWIKRTTENEKRLNLFNEPLIKNIDDILLPPLHIKLGIVSKFIQVAVQDAEEVYDCLQDIFPKLSTDKIKNGVLTGPDIRKLMKSEKFTNVLTHNYRRAWDAIKAVIEGVLGKNRVQLDEMKRLVKTMLSYFHKINSSMTLKLHFMHHHLDEFLQQLPSESDEQGERFHQVTMPMEKRYKGKQLDALLAEVCWWSQKISQHEDEGTEEEDEGHTERDMPLNILSSASSDGDDTDSDDELERPSKRSKPSTSRAAMEID